LSSRHSFVASPSRLRTRVRALRLGIVAAVLLALIAPGGALEGSSSAATASTATATVATSGAAVGIAVMPSGTGSWTAFGDGSILPRGGAPDLGSLVGVALARPIVDIAPTPSGAGYWMVASDGGVFSFGDASFYGSTGDIRLNQPIVGMASTPSGRGYWMVASDGGIFSFGDASFYGSTGDIRLNQPIVGMASTPSGRGYWMVASDGGIFSFGDAAFLGSTGAMTLNQPIAGMASTPSGLGYWMVASDGGIFSFGDAGFVGSALSSNRDGGGVVGLARRPGGGYVVLDGSGGLTDFSPTGTVTTTPPPAGAGGGSTNPPPAPAPPVAPTTGVFVSPTGTGSGTVNSPASLTAVLSGQIRPAAGTTVWLRGGTYSGGWTIAWSGTQAAPITVRSYPGEWAVLDGAPRNNGEYVLSLRGNWVVLRDFEVMVSDASWDSRPMGVEIIGDNTKAVNMLIHDVVQGFSSFSEASNVEIYGNIIYNTGIPDPNHRGHSLYLQNPPGSTKTIEDNVWFGSTRMGIHVYTTNGSTIGFVIRGNVGEGHEGNIIGGMKPLQDVLIENNDFRTLRVGYDSDNTSVTITGNRLGWFSDDEALRITDDYDALTVTGNTMYGRVVRLNNATRDYGSVLFSGNRYFGPTFDWPGTSGRSFADWRAAHGGWDAGSTWSTGHPADGVSVRPNRHEAGRAMVVVRNPSGLPSASFDPSSFLAPGARYEILNAFDYRRGPIASGTWNGGSIAVSMQGLTRAQPIGRPAEDNVAPEFGTFIVRTVR
jgi:hypothetical protein